MDCHTGPGVVISALGGEQIDEIVSMPLISQTIDDCSVVAHVNAADNPKHVVTFVGCLAKIADASMEMHITLVMHS